MTNRNQWSLVSIGAAALFVIAVIVVGFSVLTGRQMGAMTTGSSTDHNALNLIQDQTREQAPEPQSNVPPATAPNR